MSNRSRLTADDAAVEMPAENQLERLITRIVHHALTEYETFRTFYEADKARGLALAELADALPTYGPVAAYPELIKSAQELAEKWWAYPAEDTKTMARRVRAALDLAEQDVVLDEDLADQEQQYRIEQTHFDPRGPIDDEEVPL